MKTRWSSLELMVSRFVEVGVCIPKALIDLSAIELWDDQLLIEASVILSALKPISMATLALGARNANLLTSEGILHFMFDELERVNTKLSLDLKKSLMIELQKRRNIPLISTLKFLQNPQTLNENDDEFFRMTSYHLIIKFAKSILIRLYPEKIFEEETRNLASKEQSESNNDASLQSKLFNSICEVLAPPKIDHDFSCLLKEFNIFKSGGEMSGNMRLIFIALKSIKPTSTESERAFSESGNLVSLRRTRLSDKAIDALCFLKCYFKKKTNM